MSTQSLVIKSTRILKIHDRFSPSIDIHYTCQLQCAVTFAKTNISCDFLHTAYSILLHDLLSEYHKVENYTRLACCSELCDTVSILQKIREFLTANNIVNIHA